MLLEVGWVVGGIFNQQNSLNPSLTHTHTPLAFPCLPPSPGEDLVRLETVVWPSLPVRNSSLAETFQGLARERPEPPRFSLPSLSPSVPLATTKFAASCVLDSCHQHCYVACISQCYKSPSILGSFFLRYVIFWQGSTAFRFNLGARCSWRWWTWPCIGHVKGDNHVERSINHTSAFINLSSVDLEQFWSHWYCWYYQGWGLGGWGGM